MTPSEILWASAANLTRADREIAALSHSLEEGIENLPSVYKLELKEDDSLSSEPGHWVDTYWYQVYSLHSRPDKGRPPSLGTLTIAYSLWRAEDEGDGSWIGARQAKLYIGFSADKFRDDSYWWSDLCLNGAGRPTIDNMVPVAPCLWEYCQPHFKAPLNKRTWFFCIPLGSISSPEDVKREIIEPLGLLLEGYSAEAAFAKTRDVYRVQLNNV